MKKKKVKLGKSVDQKLDKIGSTMDGLTNRVDGLATTVDGLVKAVDRINKTMATKDDLKRFATKDDLQKLEVRLESKMVTNERFELSHKILKENFDEFKDYVVNNVSTKEDYSQYIAMLDPVMLEFKNAQRVNTLTGKQHCDMDDKIAGFDKRVKWLERGRILENGNIG